MDQIVHERGSEIYEKSRLRFFNNAVPDRYPYQIIHPRSTEQVAQAVKHAASLGKHISVRSGGHLFPHQHLQDNEILIDMKEVNPRFEYDEKTKQINFGPGQTSMDCQKFLTENNLFFPFGHSPTVGLGGFLLCGGQGWFFPGWGLTSDRWITQLEVVTSDGQIRICNRVENSDIFWAARGAGMGFFGIVTKFWGRTTPAKQLYMTSWTFSGSLYTEALNWILDCGKLMRPYHTELTVCSQHIDAFTGMDEGDETKSHEIMMTGIVVIYADNLEEAREMSKPFDQCDLKALHHVELRETSWEEQNMYQEMLLPSDKGQRFKCDSMLTGPEVPRKEVRISTPLLRCNIMLMIVIGSHSTGDIGFAKSTFLQRHRKLRYHHRKPSLLPSNRFIYRQLPSLEPFQGR